MICNNFVHTSGIIITTKNLYPPINTITYGMAEWVSLVSHVSWNHHMDFQQLHIMEPNGLVMIRLDDQPLLHGKSPSHTWLWLKLVPRKVFPSNLEGNVILIRCSFCSLELLEYCWEWLVEPIQCQQPC